jgi:hypothetical protein
MQLKKSTNIGLLIYFLLGCGVLFAQQGAAWQVRGLDGKESEWPLANVPPDSLGAEDFFGRKVSELHLEGYLEARLKTLDFDTKSATFHLGKQYQWINVELQPEDKLFFAPVFVRMRWQNSTISQRELAANADRILTYAEQNGYPFAAVGLDSIQTEGGKVTARLDINRGPLVLIDSLVLKGEATISQSFMEQYLDIGSDEPCNEREGGEVRRKQGGLSLVQRREEPGVCFSG